MVSFQLTLFVMMMAGYLCHKISILNDEVHKKITDLLLYMILPCNIFASFLNSGQRELLRQSGEVLILSFLIQVFCYLFARVLYHKVHSEKKSIVEYATMTSNFSFIGIPVVEVLYGAEGVILASISQIVFRIFIWTIGHNLFMKTDKKGSILRSVTSPCVDSILLGAVFLYFGWQLPGFLTKAITDMGNCMTPVCMILIGYLLANIDKKETVKPVTLLFTVVRLLVLPAIIYVFCKALKVEGVLAGVLVLETAMPAPSTTALLASKYGKDANFAAAVIFVSTLFSLITISLWSLLLT